MIGTDFAGYRIDAFVAQGGMGVVYRATDSSLDRTVALKLIAPTLAHDPNFRQRFIAESKAAASLDDPNVIPIYAAGDWEGTVFLVMRFVPGHDLGTLIRDARRLDPLRAGRITAQVASALDAAHEIGLVHRDVKPANVLVNGKDHAYLTDFGLTKRIAADTMDTQTGELLGTLDYIAPERIKGQPAGPASDLYALGCLLFHALSGRVPYPLEHDEARLWAHLNEPPPAVTAAAEGVPAALDPVLRRAMSKRPEDRFATAGEFATAVLDAAAESEVVTPTTPDPRPPKPAQSVRTSRKRRAPPTRAPRVAAPEAAAVSAHRSQMIVHALLEPFNLIVLAAMLVAGALLGTLPLTIPFALAVYAIAATLSYRKSDAKTSDAPRETRPHA